MATGLEHMIDVMREIIFRKWSTEKAKDPVLDLITPITKKQIHFGLVTIEPNDIAVSVIGADEFPEVIPGCDDNWQIPTLVILKWWIFQPDIEGAHRGIIRMGTILRRIFQRNKRLVLDSLANANDIIFPGPIEYSPGVEQAFVGSRVYMAEGTMLLSVLSCDILTPETA